jgi:hypothetical protein
VVHGGPRGGHQPLAEPCMGTVGCVKSRPNKASYEPWKGSAVGRCVDTLRSLNEKKKRLQNLDTAYSLRALERTLGLVAFRALILQCTRYRIPYPRRGVH